MKHDPALKSKFEALLHELPQLDRRWTITAIERLLKFLGLEWRDLAIDLAKQEKLLLPYFKESLAGLQAVGDLDAYLVTLFEHRHPPATAIQIRAGGLRCVAFRKLKGLLK